MGEGMPCLVAGSIYQACKFYELFQETELKGKCAIVTSYEPAVGDIRTETVGVMARQRLWNNMRST